MAVMNIRLLSLVGIFCLTDISLSVISLGFYSQTGSCDLKMVLNYLSFHDGYNFMDNPFDFIVLLLLRISFLIYAVVCTLMQRSNVVKTLYKPMILYSIFCYSFTLVKLLVFAESPHILLYYGVWFSIAWSILAAVLFSLLWYTVITNHPLNYSRLIEAVSSENVTTESGEPTTGSDSATSDVPKVKTATHVRRLVSYCIREWPWFASGFVFLFIYALARVFVPSMIGNVIDDISQKKGFSALVRSVILMSVLMFTSSVFAGLRGSCFIYATSRVYRQIRNDLFGSLVKQEIAFFDVTKSGEMVSRLTSDCQTVSATVSTNLNVFLRNMVMVIGTLAFMFVLSWRLATMTCIAMPTIGFFSQWFGAFFDRISEKVQDTVGKANHVAEEVLSTMRTVRSFASEQREAARFEDHLDKTLNISKKRALVYMGYTWTTEMCDSVILIAVLFYGGHLVMDGKLSAGQLITFMLYQLQLGDNLAQIGWVFSGLMEAVGASRKVFEYMFREPEMPLNGKVRPVVNGRIELDDVYFTYPSRPNNPILKGLNLTVGAGETVALVGPSGGGKSSIVSLIQHFYEPSSGEIRLDGVSVRDICHNYLHERIALVAQEPILYGGSIRSNILYGCDWATEEDMLNVSRMANVHDFVMELDKGYDTLCGEKGVQMSGGQKQRIAIARALVRKPSVLILDEATSALDTESESLVQEALNRCARERTVLIIAHRLSTIEKADRIAVIQKGCLMQSATHRELMEDKEGLYYSLVSRQMTASTSDLESQLI